MADINSYVADNNNDLFAAAPKPFFADKQGNGLFNNHHHIENAFLSFQLQQRRTLGRGWVHSPQTWSLPTIRTTHFSRQDTSETSDFPRPSVRILRASKDSVLVQQVQPLLFSVMPMQMLVIILYRCFLPSILHLCLSEFLLHTF